MPVEQRTPRVLSRTFCACLFSWMMAMPCSTFAADSVPKSTSQPQKKKVAKPKFIDATGETQQQRDKRLTRECKGRPNAGACAGYTQ